MAFIQRNGAFEPLTPQGGVRHQLLCCAVPQCSKQGLLRAGGALGGAEFGSKHKGSPGTLELVGMS